MESLNERLASGKIRKLEERDDSVIAHIIRYNLAKNDLAVPGTVYFDPEVDHLHDFYDENPGKRAYFVALDDNGEVIGGVGAAEFEVFENCAELQKLYLSDEAKGKGMGRYLIESIELFAKEKGYDMMYLETHTNLDTAIKVYKRLGWEEIERPDAVQHGTMNTFLIKKL